MENAQDGTGSARDLGARLAMLSPEKRALLERRLQTVPASRTPASRILPRGNARRPPLSFAQQRLWFLEQLEPGQAFYNLPLVMRFKDRAASEPLGAALNEIVARHESLRTTFVLEGGEPVQDVAERLDIVLDVTNLCSLPASEREGEAGRQAQQEVMRPFDLVRGPLIRARLFQLADDDHLLVVTMHHIVSDGWSLGIFARELKTIYTELRAGRRASLPPLAAQYGDFSIWQRNALQGETLQRLLTYWRQKLAGMPALLELPTDWPRPRVQTFAGGTLIRAHDNGLVSQLRSVAAKHGATLYMVLLAVFKVLLHRFSGITDMVVGSPIANRNRVETEDLIGFFVNTLVLRTDLSGHPTFPEVLERIRDTTMEAYAYQNLPFERLVEELSPDRDLSHNPLFQVMFGLQNTEGTAPSQNSESEFSAGISKFDLTLNATETADGLTCIYEFSTALFRPETISSLADAFGVLLQSAVKFPDRPIEALPLVTPAQRAAIVRQAATPGPVPPASLMQGWLEAQRAERAEAPAVATRDQVYSYAEIDARANRLARALHKCGIGPDDVVGLCLDRSVDLPMAMLAILKSGAALLPLDPSNPRDRLDYMLSDAGVRIVLAHRRICELLPASAGEVWCLDDDANPAALEPASPLAATVGPDNLAYVIYTSGSTGRPKGVMVTHRTACNAAQSLIEAFHLAPQTRILQFGSLSFDISIYDWLMAAGCGGTLCMAPADQIMPGQPLAETLRDMRINAITLPPSSLSVVPVSQLPDLHTIVCGGESFPGELALRWARGRRLINAYGPTETTIWATYFQCSESDANPPIGRAISGVQVHILDDAGEPLPCGFPGEITIAGAGVARGYLNQPAATAERYVPDPFATEPGRRMYRTGDRARRLPTGDIEFMSRLDTQIKLRGYRIELGEIETVLTSHPDIRDAAVVAQQTPSGEKRIAAYCTLHKDGGADRAKLLAHLRHHLPEYMIPARLQIVGALPVTVSGKVDRRRLASADEAKEQDRRMELPATATEAKLAEIFQDVLERDRIGSRDSFFDLGGHSLLATRAITRINETFQLSLPLRDLFEFPVVADLARAIEQARQRADGTTAPAITRAIRRVVPHPAERDAV